MTGLLLPSREALRERILPGERYANTRWLYSNVIADLCYHAGQYECTLAELRDLAAFGVTKSIWPMLCHLYELKLILLECQFVSVANQPSKIRIALAGQYVEPFAQKRIPAPDGVSLDCSQCGKLIEVEETQRHRKGWCLSCHRAYSRAQKRGLTEQERRYKVSQQVAS